MNILGSGQKLSLFLYCLTLASPALAGGTAGSPCDLSLASGSVTMEAGAYDFVAERYFVVCLDEAPNGARIEQLRASGIDLLSQLYRRAWFAAVDTSRLPSNLPGEMGIVSLAPWKAADKHSAAIAAGRYHDWAKTSDGGLKILVTFFKDVDDKQAAAALEGIASKFSRYVAPNVWAVEIAQDKLSTLLDIEAVKHVEQGPRPFEPTNAESREVARVDEVHLVDTSVMPPVYNGLSGAGVHIAVSESVESAHQDFWTHDSDGNAVSPRTANAPTAGSYHGTHVAGTIGGNGWQSDRGENGGAAYEWRGMAPEATLISGGGYGTAHRVDASNHSYVMDYGSYTSNASSVDRDIRGGNALSGYNKPHVWAAANQGEAPQYNDEEGYYSIYAPAKNAIAVGALSAPDVALAGFSSLGPTFDGRIKPDVAAVGCKNPVPPAYDAAVQREVMIDYIRILRDGVPVRAWEFNTDGDLEGWFERTAISIVDYDVAGGVLRYLMEHGIYSQSFGFVEDVGLTGAAGDEIAIRYRVENPIVPFQMIGRLYWSSNPAGVGDYVDGTLNFPVVVDDEWHEAQIPIGRLGIEVVSPDFEPSDSDGWLMAVERFRIDLAGIVGGVISTNRQMNDPDYPSYLSTCGTSMAAPAVTGIVGVMLEQFVDLHGISLVDNPPLPSTVKAVLIQTATDLVHASADPRDSVLNPDTNAPVLYHEGPDLATGYGLVDARAAVDYIAAAASEDLIYEARAGAALDIGQTQYLDLQVEPTTAQLKLSLAWDDVEASSSLGDQRLARLTNDLDLIVIAPDGRRHRPWRLDPPPVADCGGAGPSCGDLDPIAPSQIYPAYRGPDARNNVEQVLVDNPMAGRWHVLVDGKGITNVLDGPQSYSLVASEPLNTRTDSFILTPNQARSITLWPIASNGALAPAYEVGSDVGADYAEFAIADFTGDQEIDFLAATNENPARLYLFTRTGVNTFSQSLIATLDHDPKAAYFLGVDPLLAPDYGHGLTAADLDDDGDMDFLENVNLQFEPQLFWIARGNAHLNNGDGTFTRVEAAFNFGRIYRGWTLAMSATLNDTDRDGFPDMLVSNQASGGVVDSTVYLLRGRGDGTFDFPEPVFETSSLPATHLTIGDFNADGVVDALAGSDDDGDPGAVFLFLGKRDGSFEQSGVEAFDTRPLIESGTDERGAGRLQAVDVDGDQNLDVVAAHRLEPLDDPDQSAGLVWFRNEGDGTFDGGPGDSGYPLLSQILLSSAFETPVTNADLLTITADFDGSRCVDYASDLAMVAGHMKRVRDIDLRDASFDADGNGTVDLLDLRALSVEVLRPLVGGCN